MVKSKVVTASGNEWRYHVSGSFESTLLVLSGSLGASKGTAFLLSEHLTNTRIVMPEYAPVKTMSECLDGLDRILAEQKLDRIALYGGSFGGLIAQCWARRHPGRVSHLILSGTAATDPARVKRNHKALRNLSLIPLFAIRIFLRLLLKVMLRKAHQPQWKQEYLRLISALTKEDLASRYKVAIDLDTNYRYTPGDLPETIKVLILEGDRDRVASQRVRNQLRELYPRAHQHVFHGAGHSAMMTHTSEWSEAILEFLQTPRSHRGHGEE